jgi:hypothetical protein
MARGIEWSRGLFFVLERTFPVCHQRSPGHLADTNICPTRLIIVVAAPRNGLAITARIPAA